MGRCASTSTRTGDNATPPGEELNRGFIFVRSRLQTQKNGVFEVLSACGVCRAIDALGVNGVSHELDIEIEPLGFPFHR